LKQDGRKNLSERVSQSRAVAYAGVEFVRASKIDQNAERADMNDAQNPEGQNPGVRDSQDKSASTRPTPNRDRRRTPPLIEGEAEIVTAGAPIEPAGQTRQESSPAQAPEAAPSNHAPEAAPSSHAPEAAPSNHPPLNAEARTSDIPATDSPATDLPTANSTKDPSAKRSELPLLAGVAAASALVAGAAFWAFLPGDAGEGQTSATNAGALAILGTRVDALERETRGTETRNSAALASLREQLAKDLAAKDLATRNLAAREPASADAMAALAKRVDAVEGALAAAGRTASGDSPKTETRVTSEPAAPKVDLAPLEARLALIEKSAAQLADRLKPVEDKIEPLPGALTDLRAALTADGASARTGADQAQAAAKSAALVVVAQSIAAAIDAGQPYRPALEALGALKAPPAIVDALRPAAGGAPSLASLASGFAKIERALFVPPAPPEGANLLERLSRSASALVRVRPASDPEGDSPADHAARIERALARGDGAAALAAWEGLPDAAKAASADWAKALAARTSAQEAARALLSDAMARLARSQS
jgi:hypothetical protein